MVSIGSNRVKEISLFNSKRELIVEILEILRNIEISYSIRVVLILHLKYPKIVIISLYWVITCEIDIIYLNNNIRKKIYLALVTIINRI